MAVIFLENVPHDIAQKQTWVYVLNPKAPFECMTSMCSYRCISYSHVGVHTVHKRLPGGSKREGLRYRQVASLRAN